MNQILKMKRPRLATVIASLALFIVLGGSATAASGLINGNKIKKGTVTTKQIKNRTITKNDLRPALVKSLRGRTGPRGVKGADGVVEPVYDVFGVASLSSGTESPIGSINVAAGRYLVTATANVYTVAPSIFECVINAGGETSESSFWTGPASDSRTTLPLQMVTPDNVTTISIACDPGVSNGDGSGTIIATPIA